MRTGRKGKTKRRRGSAPALPRIPAHFSIIEASHSFWLVIVNNYDELHSSQHWEDQGAYITSSCSQSPSDIHVQHGLNLQSLLLSLSAKLCPQSHSSTHPQLSPTTQQMLLKHASRLPEIREFSSLPSILAVANINPASST